ncbi:MAG: Gfo/Idh/MocA family protein [Streptosporangiaceae bacterium]
MTRLGVGIIGAGPVTQAIHLPVLVGLADRFRVTRVMDIDGGLAAEVAARAGAVPGTDVDELLADPAVDVVAICSPHRFHAEQVISACAAGKRAVLCEKPLATSAEEAARIEGAAAASGVPLLIGTMHAYDPAYAAARRHWGDLPDQATLLRSVIYLPANDVMVASSTDPALPPRPATAAAANGQAAALPHPPTMRDAILGLAMHNLPLIREFVPETGRVRFAQMLRPWGYSVALSTGDRAVQLIGLMPGQWAPDWTLRVCGGDQELRVSFPPSYVLAGSATAELNTHGERVSWHYPENGYQAEWAHLADVAEGRAEPLISVADAVADLVYASEIADLAAAAVGSHE